MTPQLEPQPARLEETEVHVWFASLDALPSALETLRRTLSSDELGRAARFHFDRDRNRFVVGRGLLRRLLSVYTGAAPGAIRFVYGDHGKPALDDGEITFNVSHSEDRAVFAVARGVEIGVDIEVCKPRPTDRDVAERFFSPSEVRALLDLPGERQGEAFLACWTRKEAFIKARGDGLSLSLQDFDVTLDPSAPAELRRTAWSPAEPATWSLHDLSAHCPDCVAALAVHAPRVDVTVGADLSRFVGFEHRPPVETGALTTYPMG